jgi:DNA-binding beta-propeller fold protein YncE
VKSILLVDLPVRDKMDPLIRSVSSLHLDRQGSKLFLFDASALSFLVVDIVEVERATDLISAAKAGKIFKRVTLMDDPTVKKTGTYQTIDLTPQVITSTANKLYLPLQTKHGRLRVAIIDTEQATVQTFEADTTLYGQGGAVKEDDRRLYLVSGHLMVIDLENKRMIQEIHLGSRWYRSMAISDNGKHLYLFDIDNLTLAVIEMETYEVISEVLISR